MNRLFWGLLLVLLDVNLTLGSAVFELLPDFIGFFLMMKGMEQLSGENKCFDRGRHLAFALSIQYLIVYVTDLMALETMAQVGMWIFGLAALIAQLVLLRMIVGGIRGMERDNRWDLRAESLRIMWMILAVLLPLSYLLSWMPLISSFCRAGALLAGVLFLAAFLGCQKRFHDYVK